jgi:hypothetical protein
VSKWRNSFICATLYFLFETGNITVTAKDKKVIPAAGNRC